VIVEPEGLVEDALAAANDVPLRAVRGERLFLPNIPSALCYKHLRLLSAHALRASARKEIKAKRRRFHHLAAIGRRASIRHPVVADSTR
jgi:hypothetical protein